MKKTKKIIATWIATWLLISASWVSAMEMSWESSMGTKKVQIQWSVNTWAVVNKMKEKKQEINKLKKERKDFVKEKRNEIKNNIHEFRDMHKEEMKKVFKSLWKEVKTELMQIHKKYKDQAKKLIEELKDNKISFADKLKIREQLEKLREEKFNEIKEKVANDDNAKKLVEIRKAVFEKNKDLREKISEKRKEFREKRAKVIEKYKLLLINKVWNRIDKMPKDKLEKINERIDKMYEKIDSSNKLTQERKEKLLAILEWLKETINEKLKILETESSDVLDEVLNEVE